MWQPLGREEGEAALPSDFSSRDELKAELRATWDRYLAKGAKEPLSEWDSLTLKKELIRYVPKGSSVLGCGISRGTALSSLASEYNITAVDSSENSVAGFARSFPEASSKIEVISSDLTTIDLGERVFDAVVFPGVLPYLLFGDDVAAVLEHAKQVTAPGGHHLISGPVGEPSSLFFDTFRTHPLYDFTPTEAELTYEGDSWEKPTVRYEDDQFGISRFVFVVEKSKEEP